MARSGAYHLPARDRFFCPNDHSRVFPCDSQDRRTEAPVSGAHGESVLLTSYNARHRDAPFAWCWVEKRMVEAERFKAREILELYIKRRGVVTR